MAAYTIGEMAKGVNVAPRTVVLWCESGRLRHYRLPTRKGDRRIEAEHALAFRAANGLPTAWLSKKRTRHNGGHVHRLEDRVEALTTKLVELSEQVAALGRNVTAMCA